MSDFKIKVNMELSDDLKDSIQKEVEKHLKESVIKMDGESYMWTKVTDGNKSSEMITTKGSVVVKVGENESLKLCPCGSIVLNVQNNTTKDVDAVAKEIEKEIKNIINGL